MGTLSVDKLVKTSAGAAEFTLPATDGTAGQVWQTDGSGQLSVAALAADTVGTSQISALAVDTAEIAANAVDGSKIAMGSDSAGDVLYYNGTDYVRLGAGTASQTLKMNSGATAPEWVTVAAGGGDNTPSFSAYNPADQGLTTASYNKITATTEVYDVGSCYDAANAKFTVPAGEAGKYAVWTRALGAEDGGSATIGQMGQWIYLNGSASQKLYWGTPANSTNAKDQTFFGVFDLSVADYLEWYIWISFTSGTVVATAGPAYSVWGVYRLAGV